MQDNLQVHKSMYLAGVSEQTGEQALKLWHLRNATSFNGCLKEVRHCPYRPDPNNDLLFWSCLVFTIAFVPLEMTVNISPGLHQCQAG